MVVQPENRDQQDPAKGPSHKRVLCFDPSLSEVQSQAAKTTQSAAPAVSSRSTSPPVQQSEWDKRPKPNILGGNKPKRRIEPVRCLADGQAGVDSLMEPAFSQMQEKDLVKKTSRKQVYNLHNNDQVSLPESEKISESAGRLHRSEPNNDGIKAKDTQSSQSSECALKPGRTKDKGGEDNSRKEAADKAPLKSREGRTEKRPPSQEVPSVTANKENEMKEQQPVPSSSASGDFSPPAVPQLPPHTPTKTTKSPSKSRSLAKQAAEMLQDLQGLHSPVKAGAGSSDLIPGTSETRQALADCSRMLSGKKKGKDGEGTPKCPTSTTVSDVPTCSPASEAGSENSINMAAHTLMILSRAAIARTGTPLKDSMRQEGAGEKSPASSRNSKKRKQSSPMGSPPVKRESKRSLAQKKERVSNVCMKCLMKAQQLSGLMPGSYSKTVVPIFSTILAF